MNSNFIGKDGRLYMVYCPKCKRENWIPAVASGQCAWCGYTKTQKESEEK